MIRLGSYLQYKHYSADPKRKKKRKIMTIRMTYKRNGRGFIIPNSQQSKACKAAQTSAQPSQRFILKKSNKITDKSNMFYRYEFNPQLLFKFQNTIRKIEEIHLPDCIRNSIDTRFRQISPIVPRKLVVYMKLKKKKCN